ncbi:RDD family protein [Natronincola peptidivorans]|uniref:RDD family protein n=1 Tax=Natronincola peptidivorans TaxID=426128 RepID=A0A1I0FMN1_9FIRM|nr:RDD family protein [Natronincola peptidivorans]SET59383.1 RDD family protein [Natronincola peptidivorans]
MTLDSNNLEETQKDSGMPEKECSQIRPWVRYWARGIDFQIWVVIMESIRFIIPEDQMIWLDISTWGIWKGLVGIFLWGIIGSLLTMAVWSFLEAYLISRYGCTPGKWILNIRITKEDGTKLSYQEGLRRVWGVFFYGEGLFIPIVSAITNIMSYTKLTNDGITEWDEMGKHKVTHSTIGTVKVLIAIGILMIPVIKNYINILA